MRYFTLLSVFSLITFPGFSQSLRISEASSTQSNSSQQFSVAGHQIDVSERGLNSRSSLNSVTAVSVTLEGSGISLEGGKGSQLNTVAYNAAPSDNSLQLYAKPNGGFVLRENIANFLFFGAQGNIQESISNSSQSTEGESVSELAADPLFKTVVLYNPKIIRNGKEESRAQVVDMNGTTRNIFYNTGRSITNVHVDDSGQFVAIVTAASGTDDKVFVVDRYGNDLAEFTFNQNISDVTFSSDGRFITIRSNSRVGVYSVISGEREGSTSFRSMLQYATYVPEDENIIAMTADQVGDNLSDVEFHAINLAARAIERQEYSGQLGATELLPIRMERTGAGSYTFTGLNKVLEVTVRF